jgi:hypothetical protein
MCHPYYKYVGLSPNKNKLWRVRSDLLMQLIELRPHRDSNPQLIRNNGTYLVIYTF